jgi:hypothetical protein
VSHHPVWNLGSIAPSIIGQKISPNRLDSKNGGCNGLHLQDTPDTFSQYMVSSPRIANRKESLWSTTKWIDH